MTTVEDAMTGQVVLRVQQALYQINSAKLLVHRDNTSLSINVYRVPSFAANVQARLIAKHVRALTD